MLKMPGLDGAQVGITQGNVTHYVQLSVNGVMVTNIHFHNGNFVSVKLTLEEVDALLKYGNEERKDEQMEEFRRIAEMKRQASIDVETAIKEAGLYGMHYKSVEQRIETNPDGSKDVFVKLKRTAATVMQDVQQRMLDAAEHENAELKARLAEADTSTQPAEKSNA